MQFVDVGFGSNAVDYRAAWDMQRAVHADVVADPSAGRVLLLEHPPVYTCGVRTSAVARAFDPGSADVVDVDRGGSVTFHGPGQLVGYPILALPPGVAGVDYVRRLEEALIRVCADFGLVAGRVPGRSGVWLDGTPQRKIAAIGVRVARGVTMHGFALNCDVDLAWFARFHPCGITDAAVTSLSAELARDVGVRDVLASVRRQLAGLLSWQPYDAAPDLGQAVMA